MISGSQRHAVVTQLGYCAEQRVAKEDGSHRCICQEGPVRVIDVFAERFDSITICALRV